MAFQHFVAISLLSFLPSASLFAQTDDKSNPSQIAIAEIAAARESVAGDVRDIKANYKDTDPQYVTARAMYRDALGKYTKWAEYTSDAIIKGKVKKLSSDKTYASIAGSASKASVAFVANVQSVTGVTKNITILAALVDAGLKIWNGFKDRQATERKELATRFDTRSKWQQWEDVGTTPTPDPATKNKDRSVTDPAKTTPPKSTDTTKNAILIQPFLKTASWMSSPCR